MTRDEAIERGRHAEKLLKDPLLSEAFEMAREAYRKEWLAAEDRDEQFKAWAGTHATFAVEKQLRRIISDGEYALAEARKAE